MNGMTSKILVTVAVALILAAAATLWGHELRLTRSEATLEVVKDMASDVQDIKVDLARLRAQYEATRK